MHPTNGLKNALVLIGDAVPLRDLEIKLAITFTYRSSFPWKPFPPECHQMSAVCCMLYVVCCVLYAVCCMALTS